MNLIPPPPPPPPPPPLSSSIAHRAPSAPSARATGNSEGAAPTRSNPIPPQGNSGSRRIISAGHRITPRRLLAACTGGVLALCASLYAVPAQAQTPPPCVSLCTFISNTGSGYCQYQQCRLLNIACPVISHGGQFPTVTPFTVW